MKQCWYLRYMLKYCSSAKENVFFRPTKSWSCVTSTLLTSEVGSSFRPLFLTSNQVRSKCDLRMDLLFQKLGLPPYRLDQIIPLLDEASSFSSNSGDSSARYHDSGTAVEIAESIEALAWLAEFCLVKAFPQFSVEQEPAETERLERCNNIYVSPTDRAILDSIGPETLRLKNWIFDGSNQPSQTSVGTALLCQNCNWAFQRLAKGPNERNYLPEVSEPLSSPRYLLAIDRWPTLPVLQERSLQGCQFCRFLRENFLSLGVQQYEKLKEKPVNLWIEFCYDTQRSLGSVLVSLNGFDYLDHFGKTFIITIHKRLSFTIDTLHGGLCRRNLIMRIKD